MTNRYYSAGPSGIMPAEPARHAHTACRHEQKGSSPRTPTNGWTVAGAMWRPFVDRHGWVIFLEHPYHGNMEATMAEDLDAVEAATLAMQINENVHPTARP